LKIRYIRILIFKKLFPDISRKCFVMLSFMP
jgi:hypothetical protein